MAIQTKKTVVREFKDLKLVKSEAIGYNYIDWYVIEKEETHCYSQKINAYNFFIDMLIAYYVTADVPYDKAEIPSFSNTEPKVDYIERKRPEKIHLL